MLSHSLGLTLCDPMDHSPLASVWNFPCRNTGVSGHFLLQDLLDPRIKPTSPTSPVLAGGFFTTAATWEAQIPGVGCKSQVQGGSEAGTIWP